MADNRRNSRGGDSGGNPRYKRPRKKVCNFCVDKLDIDYKDTNRLSKYISERGKILPRRMSGVCARHQRELTREVKKAREIALLPFSKD